MTGELLDFGDCSFGVALPPISSSCMAFQTLVENGRFRFVGLRPGRYAFSTMEASARITISPGTTEHEWRDGMHGAVRPSWRRVRTGFVPPSEL